MMTYASSPLIFQFIFLKNKDILLYKDSTVTKLIPTVSSYFHACALWGQSYV